MNLWRRLKNLWALSEYAPSYKETGAAIGAFDPPYRRTVLDRALPHKKVPATIVSMEDPLSEFSQE